MSKSLLKKQLELFKDDFADEGCRRRKIDNTHDCLSRENGAKKKGLKKSSRKSQEYITSLRFKQRKEKTLFDDARKYTRPDHTQDNLTYIEQLRQLTSASSTSVQKILDQNKGKLAKNKAADTPKAESSSMFSDRDFDQFEKEYKW